MTAYWNESTGQFLEIESESEFCDTLDNNRIYKTFLHTARNKYHRYTPRVDDLFHVIMKNNRPMNFKRINARKRAKK